MAETGTNVFAFHCYMSAFVSAGRSVSLTVQAVSRHADGFDTWYELAVADLKASPLGRFFVERRNAATKTGDLGITGGSSRVVDGTPQILHWFDDTTTGSLSTAERGLDALTLARRYMVMLVELCSRWEDWYRDRMTPTVVMRELLASGHAVEDIEERLGLPRGWTAVEGFSNDDRLRLLAGGQPPPIDLSWLREKYLTR